MGKRKKKKRGRCGSDQGLCETRVVRVWNGGTDQIRMGRQGRKRMKLIIKEKKRKKGVLLVCVTNLPVHMQGFQVPVVANVDGHMWITGR